MRMREEETVLVLAGHQVAEMSGWDSVASEGHSQLVPPSGFHLGAGVWLFFFSLVRVLVWSVASVDDILVW